MKAILRILPLLLVFGASVAQAAEPAEVSPPDTVLVARADKASPSPLPIRGVTVDVRQAPEADEEEGAHIERPPFPMAPRAFRAEAAPAAAPAMKAAPRPSPSPTPSPRR